MKRKILLCFLVLALSLIMILGGTAMATGAPDIDVGDASIVAMSPADQQLEIGDVVVAPPEVVNDKTISVTLVSFISSVKATTIAFIDELTARTAVLAISGFVLCALTIVIVISYRNALKPRSAFLAVGFPLKHPI